jgi:diguanylate cyclase (GGDEF)-like protein
MLHYGHPSNISKANSSLEAVQGGWTNAQGEEIDVSNLQKLDGVVPGQEFSVYYQVPEDIGEGKSLCFRSKNILMKVYVEGQCLYSSDEPEAALNSKAVGTNWNYVDLPASSAGKQLEIRIRTTYASAKARIDNVYIGSDRESLLLTIYNKLFAIVTCIMFIFVGVLLIIVDIPVNAGQEKNHELLYLGLFAASIALWCFMETYVVQIFTGDARTVHIVSCCMLMMIPIPTVLYLYEAYGDSLKYFARIVVSLSVIEFIVNIVLQITGKADFQLTLRLSHILLIISAAILFSTVMYHTIKENKKDTLLFFKILRGLGLGSIAISTVIDIIRYYLGTGDDPARYVRLGILIFILCYAGSSLEKSMDTIRLGERAEFISHLAYQDGLTGLGNRTLFNERLSSLDERKKKEKLEVAVIMFDVNNLKLVNDQLGHQMGDSMLVKSARIIQNIFGTTGECFRIGGDEFVVILSGSNLDKECKDYLSRFEAAVKNSNTTDIRPYRIHIASGYSIYSPDMGSLSLQEIQNQADTRMYECKREMKLQYKNEVVVAPNETTKLIGKPGMTEARALQR